MRRVWRFPHRLYLALDLRIIFLLTRNKNLASGVQMIKQSNYGIGRSAQRLLARLAARGGSIEARRTPAAPHPPASSDADILVANDLAVRGTDGTLEITPVGRSHLARLEIARGGAEIDPFLAQHLDLVRAELQTATGRAGEVAAVRLRVTVAACGWNSAGSTIPSSAAPV